MAYLTIGKNKIMGSSVSTDANVVTVIDETCTDEQVPSALATKTYVDSKDTGKDYIEITQAEYDLLTDEEKEDIVFYIKDAVSDNGLVTVIDENVTDEQVPSALATKTYVDNKEVKISTEENNKIETKSDGIFVSKDYVEITQDEYDLLTEEEKEGIVFYIKDGVTDDGIVTVIDASSTDEQIPSAKAVYTAIQNVSAGVPADVYSKTEVDNLLADKADSTDIIDAYSKTEVDNLLNDKVNTDDVVDAYSKTEVDNLLANKADSDTIVESYSKDEVDTLLADKANTSAIIDAYTKDETNDLLDAKVNVADLVDAYSKTEVDGLLNAKVNTSDVVTALSSSSTDEEIPSAKTVFDAIQSVSAGVPADVYSKTDVDNLLADKADIDDLVDAYSKTEVDTLLDDKANVADIIDAYTKEEVNNLLDTKVDTDDLVDSYSKNEVDNLLANKADSSAIIDAYTKTETDGLLATKADTTALEELEDTLTDYPTLEYLEEVKTDLEEEFHTAMGKKMDVITSYLNNSSGNLLDTTIAPLVLCALSATNNAGLHKIMNDNFAYVITNFYSSMTPTSNRFQIAFGYGKDKMAFRRYNNGWSAWTEITTTTTLQSEINSFLTNKLTDYPTLEYLEEVKTDLENEITNIPKVTKTSELTNDSGFITANDIPDVDLEPYALKTQIPTTLPASDVYDWAKKATKPTYTASEVGALASNGTATNASKVANNLTLQIAGTTKNTFNGSSAQTFNIPNASTSTAGVMTTAQVTKLNGIATGATKNVVDTAMSSTSTNPVQNKVIYAYIQEQIQNAVKNAVKSAGDYMGKTMINVYTHQVGNPNGYTYTNNNGGFADLMFKTQDDRDNEFILIVDGVTIITSGTPSQVLKKNTDSTYELKIPFKSTFTVSYYCEATSYLHGFIYVNE